MLTLSLATSLSFLTIRVSFLSLILWVLVSYSCIMSPADRDSCISSSSFHVSHAFSCLSALADTSDRVSSSACLHFVLQYLQNERVCTGSQHGSTRSRPFRGRVQLGAERALSVHGVLGSPRSAATEKKRGREQVLPQAPAFSSSFTWRGA